jgi:hypothetical protein
MFGVVACSAKSDHLNLMNEIESRIDSCKKSK